jgi:protein TonB
MGGNDEAVAVLACFEEGGPGESNPVEDIEVSDGVLGAFRSCRLRGETALGLGLSIFLHALVPVLVMLLGLLFAFPSVSEQPFVTVDLVTLAGAGEGAGGFPGAPGSPGPGAAGGGGQIVLPNPPKPAPPVKTATQEAPRKKPAEIAKPVAHVPVKKPVVSHHRRVKAARAPERSTKDSVAPEPHRDAASSVPPDFHAKASVNPAPVPSGPAPPGAGQGLGGKGAGVGTLAGRGAGAGGAGSGQGTGGSGGYGLKQVDIPPVPIKKVQPEFPDQARQMGISGKVVLRFLVEADGRVAKASVVAARPAGVFNQSALDAIGEWRFKPGRYQGKAVAVWVELPVRFQLSR